MKIELNIPDNMSREAGEALVSWFRKIVTVIEAGSAEKISNIMASISAPTAHYGQVENFVRRVDSGWRGFRAIVQTDYKSQKLNTMDLTRTLSEWMWDSVMQVLTIFSKLEDPREVDELITIISGASELLAMTMRGNVDKMVEQVQRSLEGLENLDNVSDPEGSKKS